MTEAESRSRVVAEARSWLKTPYKNCADIKGAGVDCGMLLVRVFVDTKLCAPFDPRPYPPDWHLHRSEERYLGFIFDHCHAVALADAQPGDVIVYRFGRCYSHGAIVTKTAPLTIVHAFLSAKQVIEEEVQHNVELSEPQRAPRVFSYWKTDALK